MKKQILNFGKALSKAEQKQINGGEGLQCVDWCMDGVCNCWSMFNFCTDETEPCPE